MLSPFRLFGLGRLINRFIATLPLIRRLCLRTYVIADGRSKPICHKAKSDANEGTLYRCCTKGCDVENPTMASGDRIMAIICRDIEDSARCAGITRLIEEGDVGLRVICIPAALSHQGWLYHPRTPTIHGLLWPTQIAMAQAVS